MEYEYFSWKKIRAVKRSSLWQHSATFNGCPSFVHTFCYVLIVLSLMFAGETKAQCTDEIMDMLVKESQIEAAEFLEENHDLRSVNVEVQDSIMVFQYTFKEGYLSLPQSLDIDLMKKELLSSLKVGLLSMSEEIESEDGKDISMEELLDCLKGFRFVLMEENTLIGFSVDITTEEVRNAKMEVLSMDDQTQEKVEEQLLAEQFANDIAKYSKKMCPMVSGDVIIDSIAYDYDNLYYYSRINSIGQLKGGIEDIKNGIRKQMVFGVGETKMFTMLAKFNGGWYVYYSAKDIDSTVVIYFTPKEIKEMIEIDSSLSNEERARFSLNAMIEANNSRLPVNVDYITRLDSLSLNGGNLVYHYTVLDQFETVKQNLSVLEWSIRMQLSSDNAQIQYVVLMCVRSGYGICSCYEALSSNSIGKKKSKKSKKSDAIEICISVDELKEMTED